MESVILIGICLVAWIGCITVFRLLMESRENALIFGSLAGLLLGAAAGGAYYAHLASW